MTTKQAHTPEPWKSGEEYNRILGKGKHGFRLICNTHLGTNSVLEELPENLANAKRIKECVNACAEMDNPQEVIEGLKRAVRSAFAYQNGEYEGSDADLVYVLKKALKACGVSL